MVDLGGQGFGWSDRQELCWGIRTSNKFVVDVLPVFMECRRVIK